MADVAILHQQSTSTSDHLVTSGQTNATSNMGYHINTSSGGSIPLSNRTITATTKTPTKKAWMKPTPSATVNTNTDKSSVSTTDSLTANKSKESTKAAESSEAKTDNIEIPTNEEVVSCTHFSFVGI